MGKRTDSADLKLIEEVELPDVVVVAEDRPHVYLCTHPEALAVAQMVRDELLIREPMTVVEAAINNGLPGAIGDHRPLLIQWNDVNPVTMQPTRFNCSAGELLDLWLRIPMGQWSKDYEARTVRRRAI